MGPGEATSLFGRWWSSAFRLTTPIFVARGPALLFGIGRWLSQHGISRKRRNNLTRVLIAVERSTQEPKANSSHPSSREGHRCAGLWFCRSDSLAFVAQIVGAISLVQRNSVPSLHMRCIITASRRASATMAFFCPRHCGPAQRIHDRVQGVPELADIMEPLLAEPGLAWKVCQAASQGSPARARQ